MEGSTPFFMIASQADAFQLPANIGHGPPFSEGPELDYAASFANATLKLVTSLKTTCGSLCGVYSWSCYDHSTSLTDSGYNTHTCNGTTTMGGAFKGFVEKGERKEIIDWCGVGFACGTGCGA